MHVSRSGLFATVFAGSVISNVVIFFTLLSLSRYLSEVVMCTLRHHGTEFPAVCGFILFDALLPPFRTDLFSWTFLW